VTQARASRQTQKHPSKTSYRIRETKRWQNTPIGGIIKPKSRRKILVDYSVKLG
jgi:hypothetical protein